MNMKKSFIVGLLLSLTLVCFTAPTAFAALSNASASIDMSVSGLGAAGITWTGSYLTQTGASAYDIANGAIFAPNGVAGDWTTTVTSSISTQDFGYSGSNIAKGVATATSTSLSSVAKADTTSSQEPIGYATGYRSGQFSANGAGTVTFTIPYTLAYNMQTGSNEYADAYARVTATLYLITGSGSPAGVDKFASDTAYNGFTTSFSFTDKPTLSWTFEQGQKGLLVLTTEARTSASAVPIPAAFWLLGSGLIGLIGIRRKK